MPSYTTSAGGRGPSLDYERPHLDPACEHAVLARREAYRDHLRKQGIALSVAELAMVETLLDHADRYDGSSHYRGIGTLLAGCRYYSCKPLVAGSIYRTLKSLIAKGLVSTDPADPDIHGDARLVVTLVGYAECWQVRQDRAATESEEDATEADFSRRRESLSKELTRLPELPANPATREPSYPQQPQGEKPPIQTSQPAATPPPIQPTQPTNPERHHAEQCRAEPGDTDRHQAALATADKLDEKGKLTGTRQGFALGDARKLRETGQGYEEVDAELARRRAEVARQRRIAIAPALRDEVEREMEQWRATNHAARSGALDGDPEAERAAAALMARASRRRRGEVARAA